MISNLDPLKELSNAWIIQLARGPEITSLEPLESLTNLDWLDLSEMPNITSLEPLKGLRSSPRSLSLTCRELRAWSR